MAHRIHKCTNTLYDYAIINYLYLMSVECMNLKENIGKLFTSKSVGTGPSSYKKRIYRATVSQRLRNTVIEYSLHDHVTLSTSSGSFVVAQPKAFVLPLQVAPMVAFRLVTGLSLKEKTRV